LIVQQSKTNISGNLNVVNDGNFTTNGINAAGRVDTLQNFSVNGMQGVTASGTTCTITAITGGIITGATCV
jgi:hypothetical protein